jgi:hypothetical protein
MVYLSRPGLTHGHMAFLQEFSNGIGEACRFARAGYLPAHGVASIWELVGVVEEALEVCCLDSR